MEKLIASERFYAILKYFTLVFGFRKCFMNFYKLSKLLRKLIWQFLRVFDLIWFLMVKKANKDSKLLTFQKKIFIYWFEEDFLSLFTITYRRPECGEAL